MGEFRDIGLLGRGGADCSNEFEPTDDKSCRVGSILLPTKPKL